MAAVVPRTKDAVTRIWFTETITSKLASLRTIASSDCFYKSKKKLKLKLMINLLNVMLFIAMLVIFQKLIIFINLCIY